MPNVDSILNQSFTRINFSCKTKGGKNLTALYFKPGFGIEGKLDFTSLIDKLSETDKLKMFMGFVAAVLLSYGNDLIATRLDCQGKKCSKGVSYCLFPNRDPGTLWP